MNLQQPNSLHQQALHPQNVPIVYGAVYPQSQQYSSPHFPQHVTPIVYQQPVQYIPTEPMLQSSSSNLPYDAVEHVDRVDHVPQNYWIQPTSSPTSPIIVFLIGFLIVPGLGHLLIGQTQKGISYIIGSIVGGFIFAILCMFLVGVCFLPCTLIWSICIVVDGYQMAERLSRGVEIGQGECANVIATYGLKATVSGPVFVNENLSSNERAKL